MEDQGLNVLLDRLRQQTTGSPAPQSPNPNMGSPSGMPPQQQYHRGAERVNSAPISYPNDPSFFSSYPLYGQTPAKSQTPPVYNAPVPPASGQTDPSRTASLLGLLKFTQPAPTGAPASTVPIPRETILSPPPLAQSGTNYAPATSSTKSRPTNAQDLVASLLARSGQAGASAPTSSGEQQAPPPYTPSSTGGSEAAAGTRSSTSAPVNPQDLVFQLLNRPKPTQDDHVQGSGAENFDTQQTFVAEAVPPVEETTRVEDTTNGSQPQVNRTPSPAVDNSDVVPPPASGGSPHAIGSQAPAASGPSAPGPNKTLFTYVNPFEQLHNLTPKARTPTTKQPNSPGPTGNRKPMIPTPANPAEVPLPFSPKVEATNPVEDNDVFQQIDMRLKAQMERKAEENRKAEEQPRPQEQYLGSTEHTESGDFEGQQSTTGGDSEASREPSAKEGQDALEAPREPTASSDVLDRDEDEDADYVEQGPIKVYNFPMKPFSAITMNPDIPNSLRPRFPLGKMSDIARMPRQFDQLDRNLIAASASYIVYAISKSNGRGGIRVLRQEDGGDRVLNKDTMDRTFNVVIGRGERVLGTSVSGAVLWADVGEGFENGDWYIHPTLQW